MSTVGMKQVFHKIINKNTFIPKKSTTLPRYLRAYPNMHFNRNKIINFFYRVKGNPEFKDTKSLPLKLQFSKIRIPSKVKEVMPPQHDFINFNNMTGNEIMFNMRNYDYFKSSELVNGFYEFSKRVNLPENQEVGRINWIEHIYVGPVYERIVQRLKNLSLKHIKIVALAFDNLSLNSDPTLWRKLESAVDRLLHQLKPSDIILFLELLNKHPNRVNKDFLNKLFTIMPIHVEHLKDGELFALIKVCIKQEMVNERLFSYFIYPRIEARVPKLRLNDYSEVLRLLCKLHYQEDQEFWNLHILPCIFNYEYSHKQAQSLWENLLRVKIECPSVDVSKHLMLIENVIKQFQNMKDSNQDYENILLKLESDMSLMPVTKKTFTLREAKEAENRLKDQATLKNFMEKMNSQGDDEVRMKDAEMNISKLLDVKDWKKARYELNLAEIEKMKKLAEEETVVLEPATVQPAQETPEEKSAENVKVIDVLSETETVTNEEKLNSLNAKLLTKVMKREEKAEKAKKANEDNHSNLS